MCYSLYNCGVFNLASESSGLPDIVSGSVGKIEFFLWPQGSFYLFQAPLLIQRF